VEAVCPKCGGKARRETDTMDTFVDSSWYFYRYLSPRMTEAPFSKEAVKYWFPIDLYVGGIEHAILHLVYSRFWTKVMRDLGLVGLDEPVTRLFPQGMVHKDGEIMSKSKGNTVAPDDVIREYGADTLRLYVLFAAPPEQSMDWSETGIEGPHRFLNRVWRLVDRLGPALGGEKGLQGLDDLKGAARDLHRKTHQTIARVTEDIDERIHLNTAVAALNELYNEISRVEAQLTGDAGRAVLREAVETLVLLLNPFTPHVCEEMWERLGHEGGLVRAAWPVLDAEAAREDAIELAVQVNGKVRAHITISRGTAEETVREMALSQIASHLNGKQVVKVVVVPDRLVSVVLR
jgi:leucyl-tRNA synthetase